jgi:ubiquinone/menaquinone biosynthesis C-methylase UbiE
MDTEQTGRGHLSEADGRAIKDAHRAMWARGDYHRFAAATVWDVGPVLVDACGIQAGQRVLDVAAGSGNVAIRAASRGAHVIASDLTPEIFESGRQAARAAGVELEWAEADAEALPFDDSSFDVVTSCFGAMFAPDHQKVARELVRVCRPGGTIGLISFTPEGAGGEFFAVLAPYMPPPPPGAVPPLMWGREDYVRGLFGDTVQSLHVERREYVERAPHARAYFDLFRETFGPMNAIYESLADEPQRREALERDFLGYVARRSRGGADGPVQVPYEYLLVVARPSGRR